MGRQCRVTGVRFASILGALLVAGCGGEGHQTGGTADASAGGSPADGSTPVSFDAGGGAGGSDGGGGGGDGAGVDGGPVEVGTAGVDGAAGPCGAALPLRCGDRLTHSTVIHGRANAWSSYDRTARLESGRETVYAFNATGTCSVVAQLEELTTDLDLLLLSACDPIRSNLVASSIPLDLQTVETVKWTSAPGQTYYVVVDGYDKAEGSYTLRVDCTCN
jgi:hypothetical protein